VARDALPVAPRSPASRVPCSNPLAAKGRKGGWERPLKFTQRVARADAIVVLGCHASGALMRRLDRGIRLFQEGAAPLLLLSGGGAGLLPEAEIMRDVALARGVPKSAMLIEPLSHNTVENARETALLLRAMGRSSVLLVSDRFHLPRAALLFRLSGLRVAGWAGVRPRSRLWEIGAAIRECGALPRSLLRALLQANRATTAS
jgi:uncharacterized SAM-binding protein YcdF (DUF218 family)